MVFQNSLISCLLFFQNSLNPLSMLNTHFFYKMDAPTVGEYTAAVEETEKGKIRRSKRESWAKTINKSPLYKKDGKIPKISCKHNGKRNCKANKLTDVDINGFFNIMYSYKSKSDQDVFLLKYMNVKAGIIRKRSLQQHPRTAPVITEYYIRQENGNYLRICSNTFCSILCVSRFRVNRIARYYKQTGKSLPERRGGARITANNLGITDSIINHIKSFNCRESHYGRDKSIRSYLPPELNISKMWNLWKSARLSENKRIASRTKYSRIFNSKFNLGFGNPRQDICSFCETMRAKILTEKVDAAKVKVMTEYRIHKLRAKKFYQLLKENPPNSISICFDMQQLQPLPKLSITEVFYSRQVWLYNFTIMKLESHQTRENTFVYTWLETECGKGVNEIASCLMNFLDNLESDLKQCENPPKVLRLFSDSCAGQNKNSVMISVLNYFVQNSTVFNKIYQFFPVRGHSYMPPDRVFGRIEKVIRKKEMILSPSEYYAVFSQHATVKIYGIDWKIFDYKAASKAILKPRLPFRLQQQKVLTYEKKTFGVQQVYTINPIKVTILKKNQSFLGIRLAREVAKTNHVKPEKQKDMIKLKKFFIIPDDAKKFYDDVNEMGNINSNADDEIDVYDDFEDAI